MSESLLCGITLDDMQNLSEIFKDVNVRSSLVQFTDVHIAHLESSLFEKNGKTTLKCLATGKEKLAKPEEIVRQLWLLDLTETYGYLKEITVVQAESKEPLVGSTEFIVLRPNAGAIPVEALLVFLRSTLPQLIFQWSQDGSNHPRFDEKELLNLHVPDAVSAISKELTDSVNAATSARQRAKELLEAAKRAVEIAIEDSEAAALAYLADFS